MNFPPQAAFFGGAMGQMHYPPFAMPHPMYPYGVNPMYGNFNQPNFSECKSSTQKAESGAGETHNKQKAENA